MKRIYRNWHHWGVGDVPAFKAAMDQLLNALNIEGGVYSSDNLIAFGRNLGFLDDKVLLDAWGQHCENIRDRSVLWRTANIAWAVRQAKRLDGDFVECGVLRGVTARIIVDLVDLSDRRFWLYDVFGPVEGQHTLSQVTEDLEQTVRGKFADFPFVQIVQGLVPDSFAKGLPDKVAFAHIDMNNVAPELGALNALEDRFVPGAVIVLDDYGWLPHRDQFYAEQAWFDLRGRPVMELPTGQGVVIW